MASIPSCTTAASHSCLTSNSFSSPSCFVKLNAQFLGTRNRQGRVRPFGLGPSKCWFKFCIDAKVAGIYASQSGGEFDKDNVEQMGVEKQVLKAGTGPKLVAGQNVTVHCTGYGKDGDLNQKFWSTKDPGQQPFTFKIGQGNVIKGWDEGVLGMQVGEVARLRCSPDYAYGASGFPAWGIQPNSVLDFEIEVLRLE
ncbi:putative peptidylprolyl isomerase [Rosa chinensis]|uniref:peptidylprolyl isomerase n=1 Tax=Rosa chinensis TaxID=74649 RepID=A0A2P6QBX7_ROSCH|nr:peptidyl-prolyl cis-trans isomerase FKBP12 [Rosa chinensis]XP_024160378.1 peptidyl-prolyl cis-trans isomerase FKBP12 [Rosa chinensis]PRQ31680.1 putative peptidylprolyl isomerase [Rosa chinensis]